MDLSFFSDLFSGADPARSARLRGGLVGAAQAISQPYGNIGSALAGGALGAQQARQDYSQQQFQDLRMKQLQGALEQDQARRAALNNLFRTGTQGIAPAPQMTGAPAAPIQATPQPAPLPISPSDEGFPQQEDTPVPQAPMAQAPAPQFHLPAGFDSPQQFQAFAAAFPDEAIKRLYPEQSYDKAPHVGINPATNKQEQFVMDTQGNPKWLGIGAKPENLPDNVQVAQTLFPGDEAKQREYLLKNSPANLRAITNINAPRSSWRDLTKEEKTARGLPPDSNYQINSEGKVDRVAGNTSTRPIPASALAGIQSNQRTLQKIDKAIAALGGSDPIPGVEVYPQGIGGQTYAGDYLTQRLDPKGVAVRALVSDIGSQKLHDRSGAAVTISEAPRLQPFIPSVHDTPEAALTKLRNLKAEYEANVDETRGFYSPEAGYMNLPPSAQPSRVTPETPTPVKTPPPAAIQQLKMMGPKGAPQFDAIFGKGAAAKYLAKK